MEVSGQSMIFLPALFPGGAKRLRGYTTICEKLIEPSQHLVGYPKTLCQSNCRVIGTRHNDGSSFERHSFSPIRPELGLALVAEQHRDRDIDCSMRAEQDGIAGQRIVEG